ncbi:Mu-like prophage major head subunit gpT [Aliiroseovarius crassostreae]|uniref:Bacteriophage Mu GpT domain-containing protein n=1 Tax=Aliiroseovarius crassostreae TaxID=154981 RepID=A0A0P7KK75_9RHOB|nr:Mu-like prophage major head subunit gpT family protein [Aliiroseovarius crassostreae]KPN64260.1 hypothetical protein AKJ29_16630 [Aliiroseovarius crassostreae]SFU31166.1 Mu-like prophage major head subunit gpT [Aliiroseovarius crassostreae]
MPVKRHTSVSHAAIAAATTGFKATFQNAFDAIEPTWKKIAEEVTSTTSMETYEWLGAIPGMREWIGERFIHRLTENAYTIKNRKFEGTVAVDRDAIADGKLGTYKIAFKGLGKNAANHPDELVFSALKKGFVARCFDGQNFFDTDHPVLVDGEEVSVSNFQDGAGPAWYLLCTSQAVLPIIYQNREDPELVSHDDPSKSAHTFLNDEILFGAKSRGEAGYSFWQLAFASKAPLTAENFKAARAAMASLKDDTGRPLNIIPNLLVVPPELEDDADEIVKVKRLDNGKDNKNYGKAEVMMTPWLAA